MRRFPFALAAAVVAVLLWGEVANRRASGRLLGSRPRPGSPEVVVVLGFGNRGVRANLVNRHRVRAGLRSQGDPLGRIVMSGGAVHGPIPEAVLMARYARELGYRGELATETESRSTWENIRNVAPLIEDAARIKIVSDPLHAEKARAYLRHQRPDLAERLVRADDYRVGELVLLKPLLAAIGTIDRCGWRRAMRAPGRG